jgi:hypothetical protein
MAKGTALTIGLNSVNPLHYEGWRGELTASEFDANDMAKIAKSKGFSVSTLLTQKATRNQVLSTISSAASDLKSGDIFMLSYSGHGGQLPDLNADEDDGEDETWCLFDGELVDDELYAALSKFASGIRVLVFSDSCHSGSVVKLAYHSAMDAARRVSSRVANEFTATSGPAQYRFMPPSIAARTYQANKEFYDPILENKKLRESQDKVRASVLLISGCQDNQLSSDGTFNGLFTSTLKKVWNGGKFKRDYRIFHKTIVRNLPPNQTPNYYFIGAIDRGFEAQTPFTI